MPHLVHVLALAAALCSASSTIFIRQGLRGGDPYTAAWISFAVGTIGLWLGVLLTGAAVHVSAEGILLFVLAGLIGTVGGRLSRFIGIQKVGASVAAAIGNLQPLIASGLAIALLGERVTLPILAGTMVIVFGTVLLSASGQRMGFRPWQLAFPLLSATCFGVVAVLRKVGLGHAGPLLGAAINLTTAVIAYTALLVASGHRGLLTIPRRNAVHFVAAGVAENAGVFMTIVALSFGAVSVVTPLTACTPLFVLLLSPFFLRGVEVPTGRVVTGTLLIVFGVYLITALSGR
jgi:DME family drug/metabolite transporter